MRIWNHSTGEMGASKTQLRLNGRIPRNGRIRYKTCVTPYNRLHPGWGQPVNKSHKEKKSWGFPGGAVVENLPANAGDMGSSPGLGRSHMLRSNWAREPQLLSLSVWSLCSATREAAVVRGPRTAMKSGPRSPQLEKALTQKQRPNTAKNKNNK